MHIILKVVKSAAILIYSFLISLFIRRDEKYIAFGSWGGKLYIDNSKYLLEYMLKNLDSSYRFIWVGNSELKIEIPHDERIRIMPKDRIETINALHKCKYFFCSQIAYVDICSYNIYRNAKLIYLHHGFPIKKVEADSLTYKHGGLSTAQSIYRALIPYGHKYDFFTVSSPIQKEHYLTAYKFMGCTEANTFCFGTPRNDYLINISDFEKKELHEKYSQIFGIGCDKKIILYLPTFRRTGVETQSLYYRHDKVKMLTLLKKYNAVLIEKGHFAEYSSFASIERDMNDENYLHLTKNINVQELLAITDILISDYSGAFVDFLLLDRPIVHYVYDYDFYKNKDSGLYFTLEEFGCGATLDNYDDLCYAIEEELKGYDKYAGKRAEKRQLFLCNENGTAAKQITEYILKNL